MATLTADTEITIGAAATVVEAVQLLVLPVAGPGDGRGRLVHPDLGTYDYADAPDEWSGLSPAGAVVVSPIWSHAATLSGGAVTLFPGSLRDVICEERWTQPAAMSPEQLQALIAFAVSPPAVDDPVIWSPSYAGGASYQVALEVPSVGAGGGVTLDWLTLHDAIAGPVVLRMRILGDA